MMTQESFFVIKRPEGYKAVTKRDFDPTAFSFLPFALGRSAAEFADNDIIARHDNLPLDQIRLIQGIEFLLGQDIDVLNISMGLLSKSFDPKDPLQIATRAVTDLRIPVVVSAGNRGPKLDTLQPLAKAPWVIAVGATDEKGLLLESSSRGVSGGQCPTIVTNGVSPHVDGIPDFIPGTSFAAPKIAGIVALVQRCIQIIIHDLVDIQKNQWRPLSQLIRRPILGIPDTGVNTEALPKPSSCEQLYCGGDYIQVSRGEHELNWYTALISALKDLKIGCWLEISPDVVKHALLLMARPLEGYEPSEVGAGFVGGAEVRSFLSGFTPSRFAALFCQETLSSAQVDGLEVLDVRLGSLWDEQKVVLYEGLFLNCIGLAVAKVK
jgi:hypothetical protein